jgi:hypothetical protein
MLEGVEINLSGLLMRVTQVLKGHVNDVPRRIFIRRGHEVKYTGEVNIPRNFTFLILCSLLLLLQEI